MTALYEGRVVYLLQVWREGMVQVMYPGTPFDFTVHRSKLNYKGKALTEDKPCTP